MPKFVVEGGYPIGGRVRPAGNKNAALPMIAAAVLTDQEVVLENVPDIKDVRTLLELLRSMGAEADFVEAGVVRIRAGGVDPDTMNPALASRIRGSILLAGPMLARHGSMRLPPPGGDVIGRRRVDTHFLALRRLGAEVAADGDYRMSAGGLVGSDIFLDEPSVTATENAIMAGSSAESSSPSWRSTSAIATTTSTPRPSATTAPTVPAPGRPSAARAKRQPRPPRVPARARGNRATSRVRANAPSASSAAVPATAAVNWSPRSGEPARIAAIA
jgi:hypothetical protein